MATKKDVGVETITWDEILLGYKISKVHLGWICFTYNFNKGVIPKAFFESLVCTGIVPTHPVNMNAVQVYNFIDYKGRPISLPLNRSVWVPKVILQQIKDQSLQLTDKQMREQDNDAVTADDVVFSSSERIVNAYNVEDVYEMIKLNRTPAEKSKFQAEVNKLAAELAAKEAEYQAKEKEKE